MEMFFPLKIRVGWVGGENKVGVDYFFSREAKIFSVDSQVGLGGNGVSSLRGVGGDEGGRLILGS